MADNEEGEDSTLRGNEWELPKPVANQEGEEANRRGNEWEVVSLTASAYAAAPGPRGDEVIHGEKGTTASENVGAETSQALFMSGHFVFPPSQHENLPIQSGSHKNPKGDKGDEYFPEMSAQKGVKSELKEEENWNVEGFNVTEQFPGIQLFDEKGNTLPIHGSGFDDAATLHGLDGENKDGENKEQNVYSSSEFSSVHNGSTIEGGTDEPSDGADSPSATLQSPGSGKREDHGDSGLPCGAWWKRRVASLCAQAKETSTFWSIFVAATVMGLVLIGQRWQQERWQVLQQRWQLSLGDEKSGRILSRLKDVIVGGSRRGAYITAAPADR